MPKVKCSVCSERVDRDGLYRSQGMVKVCTEECYRNIYKKQDTRTDHVLTKDAEVFEEGDRLYVVVEDKGRGVNRRVYGAMSICPECGKEFFRRDGDAKRNRQIHCSLSCSKFGKRNGSRKSSTASAKKNLDTIFSKTVRLRDERCVECGAVDNLECAHGFSRRYLIIRWDFRNAFALCHQCHQHYTSYPLEWDDWLKHQWGTVLYRHMRELALSGRRVDREATLVEVRAMYDQLRREKR